MKRGVLYIGIDLGDKTTSMFYANSGESDMTNCVHLPGMLGNEPLKSTVCRLNDGRYILDDAIPLYKLSEIDRVYHNFKYQPDKVKDRAPEKYSAMREGICALLECIFGSREFIDAMRPLLAGKSEVVFCVGYPTNWSEQSVRAYKEMIQGSILGALQSDGKYLGVPMRLCFERESTGAYVYINCENRMSHRFTIRENGNVLVLDFGSSTVNITALGKDSRNTLYSSGNNRFGGRQLDMLIASDLIAGFSAAERALFDDLNRLNHDAALKLLIMTASEIKERLTNAEKCSIYFDCMQKNLRYDRQKLYHVAYDVPMRNAAGLIPGVIAEDEALSWAEAMKLTLKEEKARLAEKRIEPELIILTGGGAAMPIIQELSWDVFGKVQLLDASETSTIIARGLSLAAKNADNSEAFTAEVEEYLNTELQKRIDVEMTTLFESIADHIADEACRTLKEKLFAWKKGAIDTFEEVAESVNRLDTGRIVREAIQSWYQSRLHKSLENDLDLICQQYDVKRFNLPGNIPVNASQMVFPSDAVFNALLDAIATVLTVILGVFAGLLALSGVGIPILALAAGISVPILLLKGWEALKETIIDNLKTMTIPGVARLLLSDDKINEVVDNNKPAIKDAVTPRIQSNSSAMCRSIEKLIRAQVDGRVAEIRYELMG